MIDVNGRTPATTPPTPSPPTHETPREPPHPHKAPAHTPAPIQRRAHDQKPQSSTPQTRRHMRSGATPQKARAPPNKHPAGRTPYQHSPDSRPDAHQQADRTAYEYAHKPQ